MSRRYLFIFPAFLAVAAASAQVRPPHSYKGWKDIGNNDWSIYVPYKGTGYSGIRQVTSLDESVSDTASYSFEEYYVHMQEGKETQGFAFKTNAVYDAMLAPNLDIEKAFGKDWSVGLNAWIAWLRHKENNLWWQNYGITLYGRYWFGNGHNAMYFKGWHAGIYAGTLTYDIWTNGKGYQCPDMFDTFRFGCEIGWSTSIGRRWRMDIYGGTGLLHTRQLRYQGNSVSGYYIVGKRHRNYPDFTNLGVSFGYVF